MRREGLPSMGAVLCQSGFVFADESGLERLRLAVVNRIDELGLTYEEIGLRGGPSTTLLSEYKTGKPKTPPAKTLKKLDLGLGWPDGTARAMLLGGDVVDPHRAGVSGLRQGGPHLKDSQGGLTVGEREEIAQAGQLAAQAASLAAQQAELLGELARVLQSIGNAT